MIRNITIRNRDSRRLFFLNFLLRVKDLVNSDCRFGFLVKNCIYSRLEMFRIVNSEPKIRNFQTLVPKNAISYRMSPPYILSLLIRGAFNAVLGDVLGGSGGGFGRFWGMFWEVWGRFLDVKNL